VAAAAFAYAKAKAARDQAVIDAHNTGHSLREIAAVAGTSYGTIHRIIKGLPTH
jgi:hypothetical protein